MARQRGRYGVLWGVASQTRTGHEGCVKGEEGRKGDELEEE